MSILETETPTIMIPLTEKLLTIDDLRKTRRK
jgi:hypothetical protein